MLAIGGIAALWAPGSHEPRAVASETLDAPVFSQPDVVTNTYLPLIPGSVKIYSGRERGINVIIVETCLVETRAFPYDGGTVACRILDEMLFTDGTLAGREQSFFAQADDGAVWKFGEVEDDDPDDDDGDDADEPSGWIVGKLAPGDPPGAIEDCAPMLYMPHTPRAGDAWKHEDASPEILGRMVALDTNSRVRLRTGRHTRCLRVKEIDIPDGTEERRWFAPGLGFVKSRAPRCRLTLQATTIRERKR